MEEISSHLTHQIGSKLAFVFEPLFLLWFQEIRADPFRDPPLRFAPRQTHFVGSHPRFVL